MSLPHIVLYLRVSPLPQPPTCSPPRPHGGPHVALGSHSSLFPVLSPRLMVFFLVPAPTLCPPPCSPPWPHGSGPCREWFLVLLTTSSLLSGYALPPPVSPALAVHATLTREGGASSSRRRWRRCGSTWCWRYNTSSPSSSRGPTTAPASSSCWFA